MICKNCESKVKEALLICPEEKGDAPCMECPLFMTDACKESSFDINLKEYARKEKKKMSMYIFPIALIVLDVGAAIMCIHGKDYKRAVYWLAAAVLNVCVTF